LRLLMWQPYAIKETIAEFEEKVGARFSPTFFDGNSEAFNKMKVGGTKDFDIVQADGFLAAALFSSRASPRASTTASSAT
jgi:spermidine/putrescine-binding protein